VSLYWIYYVNCYGRPALIDVYPHWQPAIAVIIVHLFNLFTWSINSLSPRVKAVQHGCGYTSLAVTPTAFVFQLNYILNYKILSHSNFFKFMYFFIIESQLETFFGNFNFARVWSTLSHKAQYLSCHNQ